MTEISVLTFVIAVFLGVIIALLIEMLSEIKSIRSYMEIMHKDKYNGN